MEVPAKATDVKRDAALARLARLVVKRIMNEECEMMYVCFEGLEGAGQVEKRCVLRIQMRSKEFPFYIFEVQT